MRGNLFSWEFYFPKMRWRPLLLFFLIFLIAGKFASAQCDIEVTISSDGYGDATTWELTDGDGNAVLSGGTYGNGFEDIQQYTAVNPPYTLSITIDDFGWCDNSINYLVTVGGNEDISGTVDAVCNESFTWDFPLTSDLTPCIPSCPAPVSLSATATHNSAHLSWVSDGTLFDIEWGESGFTQGTGTMINDTSDNPYNLIGLDSSTAYQFYVRNDCGGGDLSDWAGPYEFITACEAVSVFPFIETFNADSSTKNCWKVINGNLDGDQWNLNGTVSPRSGMSAQLYTDYNSSNNDYLITPQLDLGTEEKQIKFWVKHRSDSEPDNLRVKVSTSGSEIADFSTDLLYLTTTQITTTYTEYTIDLSSYSGLVYIAFTRVDSPADGWYLYIDDVTVEDIPSCIAP
ncbi:MAG TPA: choice-of-anchor J domain-containing protein, partial [Moheibacter sp.]|nr:choice-of-anchor J domain-containing protein [Moheibacter sp.]